MGWGGTTVHNRIPHYTAERKKDLPPFMTAWMDLESIMLSEISQVCLLYTSDAADDWLVV